MWRDLRTDLFYGANKRGFGGHFLFRIIVDHEGLYWYRSRFRRRTGTNGRLGLLLLFLKMRAKLTRPEARLSMKEAAKRTRWKLRCIPEVYPKRRRRGYGLLPQALAASGEGGTGAAKNPTGTIRTVRLSRDPSMRRPSPRSPQGDEAPYSDSPLRLLVHLRGRRQPISRTEMEHPASRRTPRRAGASIRDPNARLLSSSRSTRTPRRRGRWQARAIRLLPIPQDSSLP